MRYEIIVIGRVQMVMFRDYTCRKARALSVVGEVENLSDGSVRVVAEGHTDNLERLLKKIRTGSLLSRVKNIQTRKLPAEGKYETFTITYGK